MKAYISVSAENADEAGLLEKAIVADLAGYFA
jgi:hypothetical protein